MKRLTTFILACGMIASGVHRVVAAPVMRLSADGGLTWTNVVDNGPLDVNPSVGLITYAGTVGNWVATISSGLGQPLAGTPLTPTMDLSTFDISLDAETLLVQMSDTNFIPFPNETFVSTLSTTTQGTVTQNTYRDSGNVLFGTTASSATASGIITQGPYSNGTFVQSNAVVVANGGIAPYSLTLETVIVHTGAAQTSSDAFLFALPPPPCSCSLTFNSPQSITNCAGDTIPDVVASENCGNGSVSVPVTLIGAVTNGVCPQIITRTNTATDDCGGVHTFVQTITVNCLPDCRITPSVTNAIVGGSNYTASVANAGPGATYVWNVLNGSITAGQGTTQLTWAAGTDTNSPVTIVVTITAVTGCQSTCSAGVRLCPKPPQISLGGGDTATIGFWHNKNGQGLILGAPNSPALGNWLASNFPCMYGNLAGKSNGVVAALFMTDFGVKGQKTYAQVLAGAFACYFTSSNLGGNSNSAKFGFNVTPGGTGSKVFNVGNLGTVLGLQNNTSYTVLQILQAADSKCPFGTSGAVFDALNTIFDGINQTGDIT